LAAQRFGQAFFENGALPGAVIEAPGTMSDPAIKRFRETWNGGHQGVANAHRIGVLTEGAKLAKVSVSPEDAQFLETRAFQVPDIARIYGVPPHLIADASNSTSWGSGLAEQNLAFGQFSLRPWIERIEDAHGRLLTTHGLPDVFIKLNLDALLRASLSDRYVSYQMGIQNEFLTRNEARKLEDMPPLPGGDGFPAPSDRWPVTGRTAPPPQQRSEADEDFREELMALLGRPQPQPVVNVTIPGPGPGSRRIERNGNGEMVRIVEEN
jgi:HK97 family phage portal protein